MNDIVGDAGVLFDPEDVDDITRVLATILADDPLRRELARRGAIRSRLFEWKSAALNLWAALHGAAGFSELDASHERFPAADDGPGYRGAS